MKMDKRIIIGAVLSVCLIVLLGMTFVMTMFGGRARTFSKSMGEVGSRSGVLSDSMGYIPNYAQNAEAGSAYEGEASADDSKFSAMYFKDYGTNVFIDAARDRLSTFSLEKDTASYTLSKTYIMRGELPPTDAVRPEEFVNYFDYGYPNPKDDFGIYSEAAPSPFDNDIYLLRVGVKAFEDDDRKDAILTFVVDVSGSMNTENRLGLVKKSLKLLVENLGEGDQVAIVKYNTVAESVLGHTKLDEKQKILDAIDSLSPGGSTNAEAGLLLGYQKASDAFQKGKINRVILLSDGVANVGNTGPDAILKEIGSYKQKGILITAIGVGMGNYNDVLLEQLADRGDGNYYYINDYDEAKEIFSKKLFSTLQTIAKDAKIQVEFNQDAISKYRLIGYENRAISDQAFRDDSKDAGELGSGHEATAIYELMIKNKDARLGKVYLRYKTPDTNISKELVSEIAEENLKSGFDSSSDSFKLGVSAARFSQILKLTQPPPSISKVEEIVSGLDAKDDKVSDFKTVLYNARRLIEIKQGEGK